MIRLQTPVETFTSKRKLTFEDKIMVLGSCFSDNIGRKLLQAGFDVMVNPFGTLYNPSSIARSIGMMQQRRLFTAKDCVRMGSGSDMICSFSHHTSFARKTEEEFLQNANEKLLAASDFFSRCNILIITWGTAWCYRHLSSDMIVSNCLKINEKEFARERLSVGEIVRMYDSVLSSLASQTKTLFTVSPIRHLKDGAHGNQISKSTLLLAVEETLQRHPDAGYFPSFEIVMDELRDYRFYAEDMTHPSAVAIDYIWEKFSDTYMSPATKEKARLNIKKSKSAEHRKLIMDLTFANAKDLD